MTKYCLVLATHANALRVLEQPLRLLVGFEDNVDAPPRLAECRRDEHCLGVSSK